MTKSEPQAGRPKYYEVGDGMKLVVYQQPFRIQVHPHDISLLVNPNMQSNSTHMNSVGPAYLDAA